MVMVGRRVLHRSLPTLFALLLALFTPAVGHSAQFAPPSATTLTAPEPGLPSATRAGTESRALAMAEPGSIGVHAGAGRGSVTAARAEGELGHLDAEVLSGAPSADRAHMAADTAEHDDRTAAGLWISATGPAAAEPLTVTGAVFAVRALGSRFTAGVAGPRAPPAITA